MKKILLILLLLPAFSFAQKVKSQTSNQDGELKDLAGKYCTIVINRADPLVKQIQTDSDIWDFTDASGNKLKFKTVTAVINYMDKNGWQFVIAYTDQFQFIIFKKAE